MGTLLKNVYCNKLSFKGSRSQSRSQIPISSYIEVVFQKIVLKNIVKEKKKQPVLESIFKTVADCFPLCDVIFLKIAFVQNSSDQLILA